MKKFLLALTTLFVSHSALAAGGHMIGLYVGTGIPYLAQGGLDYVHSSGMFSAGLGYNNLSLSVDDVSVSLTKMEVDLRVHPFSGSFYIGAGFGQQTLASKASDTVSGQTVEAKIEVKATTLTPKLGWMWGAGDGGFYGGIEFGMQNPSGAKSTTTTNADASVQNDPEYIQMIKDTNDQAEKYGETGFATMTLFRLGYLF